MWFGYFCLCTYLFTFPSGPFCLAQTITTSDGEKIRNDVQLIKSECGKICDTSIQAERNIHKVTPGKYVPEIKKDYDCKELFQSSLFEQPLNTGSCMAANTPPRLNELPDEVTYEFTFGGRVQLLHIYMKVYAKELKHLKQSTNIIWTREEIENKRKEFQRNELFSPYGDNAVYDISRHIDQHMLKNVKEGRVLVIGSNDPWIEVILLEKGAKHVTTLEYMVVENSHPNITAVTPDIIREMYLDKKFQNDDQRFDAMVTFSSLEHSGLGRYGDGINPWGDLITMAKTRCIMKKTSVALIGVPSQFKVNNEYIGFNAGRVYGSIQLSHLFANWKQVFTEAIEDYKIKTSKDKTKISVMEERVDSYGYQPIYILRNEIF